MEVEDWRCAELQAIIMRTISDALGTFACFYFGFTSLRTIPLYIIRAVIPE